MQLTEFTIRAKDQPLKSFSVVGWSEHPYVVYIAINVRNGKTYIGATQKGLRARKLKHLANAKRGQRGKFYASIRKYGSRAFKFIVLRECVDYFDAMAVERQLIALIRPDYNLTAGGGGVSGLRMSDSSKAKMRAAKLGKPGHPCHEWVKAKNAELRRAGVGRTQPTSWRAVQCFDDGKIHPSVKAAALYYGIPSAAVSASCTKGRRRNGYTFRKVLDGSHVS